MQQLLGKEGTRVRRAYERESARTGVQWSGRSYKTTDFDDADLVNKALSAVNTSLYGVVHAVIVSLGCSPGLGFVHARDERSFVYDIADLYKVNKGAGIKLTPPRKKKDSEDREDKRLNQSQYLLFLGNRQYDELAQLAVDARHEASDLKDAEAKIGKLKKRIKQIIMDDKAIDVALFGRMVADDADLNVDAASQFANAFSVQAVDTESDFLESSSIRVIGEPCMFSLLWSVFMLWSHGRRIPAKAMTVERYGVWTDSRTAACSGFTSSRRRNPISLYSRQRWE